MLSLKHFTFQGVMKKIPKEMFSDFCEFYDIMTILTSVCLGDVMFKKAVLGLLKVS